MVGGMITVYVGPKSKRYAIHEPLLAQYEWFRKEINASSDAASPDSITLIAEDPKIIELLITWLYRKTLKAISTIDENVAKEEATAYVDLYLRACAWEIRELQNSIMDRLRARQVHSNVLSTHSITKIYLSQKPWSLEARSALLSYTDAKFVYLVIKLNEDRSRLYPIDASPALILKPELHSLLDDGDRAFVEDYVGAIFQLYTSPISNPDKRTGCHYHKHKEGEACGL